MPRPHIVTVAARDGTDGHDTVRYSVFQSTETIPIGSNRLQWVRRFSEIAWRPLSVVLWGLQAYMIVVFANAALRVPYNQASVAWGFIAVQISSLVALISEDGWRFCTWNASKVRPKTRLVGDTVPMVDLIVVTCGEEIQVILDTVRTCCSQDYPSHRFRVLVSDDGNDDDLKAALAQLNKLVACEVLYYRRPGKAGSKKGYKAGNMNAALAFLDSLGSITEYCAFTDADMLLEKGFLRACSGHILLDPKAGVVIVPQCYYNLPVNDPLFQSMHVFNHSDQLQRDSLGAAWETGPGVFFRREALAEIGGFDTRTMNEDVLCGMMLNGSGWNTILCHEQLQWGLVPDTLAGHIAQRLKWSAGNIRAAEIIGFGLNDTLLPCKTWNQRAAQIAFSLRPYASGINRFLRSWAVLFLVSTGKPLVIALTRVDIQQMMNLSRLLTLLSRLESLVVGAYCGYRKVQRRKQGYSFLTPYLFIGTVKELLPQHLSGTKVTFIPTGLLDSSLKERDAKTRPPLALRMTSMILAQGLWYHILVLTIVFGLIGRGISNTRRVPGDSEAVCRYIWTTNLAPGLGWDTYLDLLTPLLYAMFPPTVAPRRDLLEPPSANDPNDEVEGRLPTAEARLEKWNMWWLLAEVPQVLIFALANAVRFSMCPT